MESLKFKFQFLNDKGQPANFLAKHGELTNEQMVLDGQAISVAAIGDVDVRGIRLASQELEAIVPDLIALGHQLPREPICKDCVLSRVADEQVICPRRSCH